MKKKIIITESQFQQILNEEMGISKEVYNASKELKKELFNRLDSNPVGEFNFLDIIVKYHVYFFETECDFIDWFDNNPTSYLNGYSSEEKTMILTIISIDGNINVSALNDTIQHELEHYYQTKMANNSFTSQSYINAYNKLNDYNDYIRYASIIEYYSKHIEIDALVNGAYYAVEGKRIDDYQSFIESTEIKYVKEKLREAYNFFKSCPFQGYFYSELIVFIKCNNYYRNWGDASKLRGEICKRCQDAYTYFVRKTSRVYALIQNQKEEELKINSQMSLRKYNTYK